MPARDAIDLVILGALWGASFLFMRVAAPAFGPVTLIAVRVSIAAVLLLPLMARERGWSQARTAAGPLVLVGALNTAIPFTLFAYAALTLPAGLSSDGLPLGLQLIGRPFEEETLFSIAQVIEDAAPKIGLPERWWA